MADLCISQSSLFLIRPKIGAFHNIAFSLPLADGGARRLQHNNGLTYHGFGASRGLSYTTSIQKLGVVSDTKTTTIFTVDSRIKDIGIESIAGGGEGGVILAVGEAAVEGWRWR
ncbi:keratin [Pyrus ussuriensis x Pyrus communis]|uniref:Keratin n=1 Tax=Pyrus ussuriensis x Pyrus communis TaxID=2448454 RepID=A0A5N5I4P9_9ROSA|nr:keratin [Pyrus ussuriensis x Pyrus communis]